jgi:hypothetical protein
MTVDERYAIDREFTYFGALRFVLYFIAGLSLMSHGLVMAGAMISIGATIEVGRRIWFKFKD